MKDNILPEEKLLKLIRAKKKDSKSSLEIKPLRYRFFLDVNKIILAGFALSSTYLAVSLAYPWFNPREIKLPVLTPEKVQEVKKGLRQEALRPYEFYAQGIAGRSIFITGAAAEESAKGENSINTDLTKDINLVGIIAGESSQAVIEDKKNQKTYYVTRGQFIGDFQVEDIQAGKIILGYKGARYELYL